MADCFVFVDAHGGVSCYWVFRVLPGKFRIDYFEIWSKSLELQGKCGKMEV